jgi:hypothetical protein
MSKPLAAFTLDKSKLKAELRALARLLGPSTRELSERNTILPFFKKNRNLASLIGLYNAHLCRPTLLKNELSLFGDCACDLAIGNQANGQFSFVEFEDAIRGSVFKATARGTPEWSTRLEHGFSQIVDWFYALDDLQKTARFRALFGTNLADYLGILVIGRDGHLNADMRERLRWRSMNTQVAGKHIYCVTLDELFQALRDRVALIA